MLFWHLGVTAVIVVFTVGRRRIDYRVVLFGAILPDLIDKPIGLIFWRETFQTSRLFGHTLVLSIALLVLVIVALRGDSARRWFILPIATLAHLGLDAMWVDPVTLFWPAFGLTFPRNPIQGGWLDLLLRPFTEPLIGLQELVGLLLLGYLFFAFGLNRAERRRDFVRTGRLPSDRELGMAGS